MPQVTRASSQSEDLTQTISPRPRPGPALGYELPEVVQEFFLPVWGQVRLTASELRLVDHPAFARLGDIYQLGQTHFVYRGATHRRWEHALGTLQAAQVMVVALQRNHREAESKRKDPMAGKWRRTAAPYSQEVAFIRLAALLHDIGHLPAGHTFEDELGLLGKHDADTRLNYVLDRRVWRSFDEPQTLRELIDSEYGAAAKATGLPHAPSEIFLDIVSKSRAEPLLSSATASSHVRERSTERFRLGVCRDIVGNTICADLLDYLQRDWHHLGKEHVLDSRLLDYFEIRKSADDPEDVRLVVNLREASEVRADAVTAIFDLLESRYQLGEVALFHRTKLTASAMLERLVAEIADAADDPRWFASQLDHLLESTDEEMLQLLVELGRAVADERGGERAKRVLGVLHLGRSLRYRKLHKQVMAFKSFELPSSLTFVRESLGGSDGSANRLAACRSLERDFALPSGSVVMYCPAKVPHAKIARVQVLIHGQVDELAKLEEDRNDPAMTCGLLGAQRKRFEGLWRVQVSVSPEALSQLRKQHLLSDFERTIESLVLRAHRGSSNVDDIATELAEKLLANEDFDTGDRTLLSAGEVHARTASYNTYPTGAPTLSTLMVPPSHG